MSDWTFIAQNALMTLWESFLLFVPKLVLALLIFIIGWFIAVAIGKIVSEILIRLKFNKIFEKGSWERILKKAELDVHPAEFIGGIIKWILIIVLLQIAVGVLDWKSFENMLADVVAYLPNVVVSALIFVVAVVIADILAKIVVVATEGARFSFAHLAGEIVRWSIWIFAILAVLHQLGIARYFMETIFVGIIGILVISLGLAFGLGGKDAAAECIEDIKRRIKK